MLHSRSSAVLAIVCVACIGFQQQLFAQAADVQCSNCIDSSDIADFAVTQPQIAPGAVTKNKIRNNAVTEEKVKDFSIGSRKIKGQAITTGKLAFGAVTAARIAEGAAANNLGFVGFNTRGGVGALRNNDTGFENTAIGFEALAGAEDTFANTAVGVAALLENKYGESNTAIGAWSLALLEGEERNEELDSGNTAIGNRALGTLLSGSENIGIGAGAGFSARSGSNNIYIGSSGSRQGSNNIYIGNPIEQDESDTIRLGGRSALGANGPRTFITGIRGTTTGSADAVTVVIDGFGQLGTVSSSARHKEDIADLNDVSSRVMNLRPVSFRYKKSFADGEKPVQYGLLAEEVAESFPELVAFNEEGEAETVKYRLLSVLLLNELQKQGERIQEQDAQIARIQSQAEELEVIRRELARLSALSDRLDQQE